MIKVCQGKLENAVLEDTKGHLVVLVMLGLTEWTESRERLEILVIQGKLE